MSVLGTKDSRWYNHDELYYLHDSLGSVIGVERTGTVKPIRYNAFGVDVKEYNKDNSFGFSGKLFDETTKLYNFGYRDYSTTQGRFTTVDPIKDGNNWYVYVNSDPVNYIDLLGLSPGDPFEDPVDAAYDFGLTYNDDSIRNGVEYGSIIYSYTNNEGKVVFSYNVPIKGTDSNVAVNPELEETQQEVSTVHTHGSWDPELVDILDNNNIPSISDAITVPYGSVEYVATPDGSLIAYDSNWEWEIIKSDLPSDIMDPNTNYVSAYENTVDDVFIDIDTVFTDKNKGGSSCE